MSGLTRTQTWSTRGEKPWSMCYTLFWSKIQINLNLNIQRAFLVTEFCEKQQQCRVSWQQFTGWHQFIIRFLQWKIWKSNVLKVFKVIVVNMIAVNVKSCESGKKWKWKLWIWKQWKWKLWKYRGCTLKKCSSKVAGPASSTYLPCAADPHHLPVTPIDSR